MIDRVHLELWRVALLEQLLEHDPQHPESGGRPHRVHGEQAAIDLLANTEGPREDVDLVFVVADEDDWRLRREHLACEHDRDVQEREPQQDPPRRAQHRAPLAGALLTSLLVALYDDL